MFTVIVVFPIDSKWIKVVADVKRAAGKESIFDECDEGMRELRYFCENFSLAVQMRKRILSLCDGVKACIRESVAKIDDPD